MQPDAITHLIFDLGGVIIELSGKPIKQEWFPADAVPDDIWECWLTCEAPRQFESGKLTEQQFVKRTIAELSLNVSEQEFLDHFLTLPHRVYPGAKALLTELRQNYVTALLSNSNPSHWRKKLEVFHLGPLFEHHFASHLMGRVKPDASVYQYVLDQLNVNPAVTLFFDDNMLNVEAARRAGLNAEQVRGVAGL
ncbi:MAG: HAD family phosphatase, partial [Pseudomonadota bacterium]